jgi:hypothetical protein
MMKRTAKKKEINLNIFNEGCSPCLNEVQKAQRKIGGRKVSEIKIDEIKKIVSSLFDKE